MNRNFWKFRNHRRQYWQLRCQRTCIFSQRSSFSMKESIKCYAQIPRIFWWSRYRYYPVRRIKRKCSFYLQHVVIWIQLSYDPQKQVYMSTYLPCYSYHGFFMSYHCAFCLCFTSYIWNRSTTGRKSNTLAHPTTQSIFRFYYHTLSLHHLRNYTHGLRIISLWIHSKRTNDTVYHALQPPDYREDGPIILSRKIRKICENIALIRNEL